MLACLWLYIKIFLAWTIPFTLLMFPLFIAVARKGASWIFLAGGAVLAAVVGSKHILAVKRVTGRVDRESLRVRQRRELRVPLSSEDCLKACGEAVAEIVAVDVPEIVQNGGCVVHTGRTRRPWGDVVTISVAEEEGGKSSTVEITSAPRLKSVLADYGDNLARVEALSRWITERVGGTRVV